MERLGGICARQAPRLAKGATTKLLKGLSPQPPTHPSNAPNQKRAVELGDDAWLCSRLLNLVVRLQLIQVERSANSPANRLIFACPMAIPTLVSLKFFAGESRQKSKTSAM